MSQQFPKSERLSSRKEIDELFKQNNSFQESPVRCVWAFKQSGESPDLKAAFSVPKRLHKKAVSRNLLKRRMKEAYRLNKSELSGAVYKTNKTLNLMFVFTKTEIVDFKDIEGKIILILQRLTLLTLNE